jgi:hypothetical protein
MVAREQTWLHLLELDAVAISAGEAIDRTLSQVVTAWSPKAAARRRRRREAYALLALTVLAAAVLATIGFARANTEAARNARRLGISTDVQADVVAHLPAVRALAADPWLIDDYPAVRELGRLCGATAASEPSGLTRVGDWIEWRALSLGEQAACVHVYQQVAQRRRGQDFFANSAAFAGLAPEIQEKYRSLEGLLQATLRAQPPDQRRWLLTLPAAARALAIYQLIQTRATGERAVPADSPVREAALDPPPTLPFGTLSSLQPACR